MTSPLPEPRSSPAWALAVLTAIYTCGFADRIIMQVLVEPIRKEFGLSDTQIGLVVGLAFAVLNVLLGIWFARIAERRRRLTLLAIGTVLWSLATAACGLATSFLQLFVARASVGVGEAIGLPATASIVSDYFPRERRTTALSILWIATPVGAFLGSTVGGVIAQAYGWRAAFLAAAAPGFVLALILALTVGEPVRGQHDNLPPGSEDEVPPLSAVLARMWARHSLRHILSGSTVAAIAGFGINAFLAAWLARRFGFSIAQAGITVGLITSVPTIIGVVGSGWLSDRMARTDARSYALVPGVAMLAAGPIFLLAVTRDTPAAAIGLLCLAATFQYSYLASYSGTLQNMMHPRMRASATAVMSLIVALVAGTLGPLAIGLLSDTFSAGAGAQDGGRGLGQALAFSAILYLWAAAHFFRGTRDLRKDMAAPLQTD